MTHKVRWTPEAEADAAGIVDYFNDPVNANKVIDKFVEKADGLETFPERGRVVPELRLIGVMQYHEVFYKPWRMIYRIADDGTVWIMAMLDARRDLKDLLHERFVRGA